MTSSKPPFITWTPNNSPPTIEPGFNNPPAGAPAPNPLVDNNDIDGHCCFCISYSLLEYIGCI